MTAGFAASTATVNGAGPSAVAPPARLTRTVPVVAASGTVTTSLTDVASTTEAVTPLTVTVSDAENPVPCTLSRVPGAPRTGIVLSTESCVDG
nr:hypothetical protein GCM10020092_066020 [Actinoplanes digitatis]